MINLDRKFIFCHNEKTAGTSISRVLSNISGNYFISNNLSELGATGLSIDLLPLEDPVGYPNMHAKMILWQQYVDLENFFSFGFVRDPKTRMVSLYLQQVKTWGNWSSGPIPKMFVNITPEKSELTGLKVGNHEFSFDYFVREFVPVASFNQVRQFYGVGDTTDCLCSFVGRYETLKSDWAIICDRLEIPRVALPHKNISPDYNVGDFYTPDLLDFMFNSDFYSEEYEVFGYEKR